MFERIKINELQKNEYIFVFYWILGAKEFANEAMKATSEYATQAGELLQEKVPEAFEGWFIEFQHKIKIIIFYSSWKKICRKSYWSWSRIW